ncbi:hypothetical protein XHC_3604 [Xanthomonas hortorum pv. carotae str. M081]|nr:hypothetical protein XHC_3604 [Xanthomonas hortorum pv. carotae str. M081]
MGSMFVPIFSACRTTTVAPQFKTKDLLMSEESRNDLVEYWRSHAGDDNPAGPLFISGAYAEADIGCEAAAVTEQCGTICTGSATFQCC